MKIRKNGAWEDYKYPIYESATDAITSLPTDIIADGSPLLAWTISGNMSQSGTPTPQNPIQPEEVGVLVTSGEHAGQYKIPISSGNTTTPIYLGEVPTTRKVKKYVIDGTENWNKSNTYIGSFYAYLSNMLPDAMPDQSPFCSHLGHKSGTYSYGNCRIDWNSLSLWVFDTNTSVEELKSYLAAQYAAGTPVTIWYVLATPTTGIVNEPIRKIGEYADTISNVAEIPTTAGEQTFDVDTSLKPSSVEITYKGWHKHTPKEYDNGSWS